MHRTADIYEVARLLIEHGNPSQYSRENLPPYQAAILKALPNATDSLVDEIGFVNDKDFPRLYLTKPIDYQWLGNNVELEPPLRASPEDNRIYGEWIEIVGGAVSHSEGAVSVGRSRRIRTCHRILSIVLLLVTCHFYNVSASDLCVAFGTFAVISILLEFLPLRRGRDKPAV